MHEQVGTLQLVHVVDGAVVVITVAVVLGQAHVALGVDGVVVPPVGHRGHGHGGLEHVGALGDAEAAHVPAIAPSPDADAGGVGPWLAADPGGRRDHVLGLVLPQLAVGHVPEVAAAVTGAARVHAHHHIASLRHQLVPQVVAAAPLVQHLVAVGAAVLRHQYGPCAAAVETRWRDAPGVQLQAIRRSGHGKELLGPPSEAGHLFAELRVVLQGLHEPATPIVQRGHRRFVGGAADVDEVAEALAELGLVHAAFRRQFLEPLAVQAHGPDLLPGGALHAGGEDDPLPLGIDAGHREHIVLAGSDGPLHAGLQGHPVHVVPAALLAGEHEPAAIGVEVQVVGDLHVGGAGLPVHGLGLQPDPRRLHGGELQGVDGLLLLQAVQAHEPERRVIRCPAEAGQVEVLIRSAFAHGDLAGGGGLQVVHEEADLAVLLAGLRVLEAIFLRVKLPAVVGQVELLHLAFVAAQVQELGALGAPRIALDQGELLLIHPVGGPVQHLVPSAVVGDARLGHAVQVHHVQVVLPHEGRVGARRTDGGEPLKGTRGVAQGHTAPGLPVVHPVPGVVAVAVQGVDVGLDQQLALVRAELIALDRKALRSSARHQVRQRDDGAGQGPVLVPVALDGKYAVGGLLQGGVVLTVQHALQTAHVLGAEGAAVPDLAVGQAVLGLKGHACQEQGSAKEDGSLHGSWKCNKDAEGRRRWAVSSRQSAVGGRLCGGPLVLCRQSAVGSQQSVSSWQ